MSVPMTAKLPAAQFNCPACGARYKVVQVETETAGADSRLACRHCGAPLSGREGRFILKYFMVDRPQADRHIV